MAQKKWHEKAWARMTALIAFVAILGANDKGVVPNIATTTIRI